MLAQEVNVPYLTAIFYEIMSLMHVRRFWVAGLILIAVLALLPFSFHAERHLETATRVEGSEAETVKQDLISRFRSPFVDRVVLAIQGLPPANSEEGGQALSTIVAGLKDEPGVSGVVSYLELRDPIFLGTGGGTFVLVGLASPDLSVESIVSKIPQPARALSINFNISYRRIQLNFTG
jgi:RND superfamily putative drug exporter